METSGNKNSLYSNLAKVALDEYEQRFRILMETTTEGVVIHDRFKILETNQAFADMFGFKPPDILGRDVLELIVPQSRDFIMNKLLAGDESPFEVLGCKKDGATIALESCSRIIPYGGNRINLTLFRRSNYHIQAASEHPVASDRLDPLFNCAPEAYYLADVTGTFIDVNKATRELFGHEKESIIGKSFLKLKILAPDQIHRAARNLALNILGKPSEPEEYVIERQDGSRIPVEISARPVKINGKKLLFGMVRDISEKKKIEKALHRTIKEIEALVAERGVKEKQAGGKSKSKPQPAKNMIGV
ncbi:MAG: PAS domain S-box protein [Desulfobacteraceae bacterium]|jgi:PAS domain S-box-containing protein|nr:PAS domain S-box protein [Desulfobacteraceae bacterium]